MDISPVVIFPRRDMERLAETLTARGYGVEPFVFDTGDLPLDLEVDVPPYNKDRHLKLLLDTKYVCTSVGFIITNASDVIPQALT